MCWCTAELYLFNAPIRICCDPVYAAPTEKGLHIPMLFRPLQALLDESRNHHSMPVCIAEVGPCAQILLWHSRYSRWRNETTYHAIHIFPRGHCGNSLERIVHCGYLLKLFCLHSKQAHATCGQSKQMQCCRHFLLLPGSPTSFSGAISQFLSQSQAPLPKDTPPSPTTKHAPLKSTINN